MATLRLYEGLYGPSKTVLDDPQAIDTLEPVDDLDSQNSRKLRLYDGLIAPPVITPAIGDEEEEADELLVAPSVEQVQPGTTAPIERRDAKIVDSASGQTTPIVQERQWSDLFKPGYGGVVGDPNVVTPKQTGLDAYTTQIYDRMLEIPKGFNTVLDTMGGDFLKLADQWIGERIGGAWLAPDAQSPWGYRLEYRSPEQYKETPVTQSIFEASSEGVEGLQEWLNTGQVVTWKQAKDEIAANPQDIGSYGSMAKFIAQEGSKSIPDMMLIVGNAPLWIWSQIGQMAEQRANNLGRDKPTGEDIAVVLPFALAVGQLNRLGAEATFLGKFPMGMIAASTGPRRIAQASGVEATAEGVQAPLELAATTVGTPKSASLAQYGDTSTQGLVVGGPTAGAIRTGVELAKQVEIGRQRYEANQAIKELEERLNQDSQDDDDDDDSILFNVEDQDDQAPVTQGITSAEGAEQRTVKTQAGTAVQVMPEVIDAVNLFPADAEMQPRDRDRAAMEAQVGRIASELDPNQLGLQPDADRGAPIIGPDNVIESGNGRVMAIMMAQKQFPERFEAYKNYLEEQGYDRDQLDQMQVPVLVQRRTTEMSQDERVRFAQEANAATLAKLSATEQAKVDASRLTSAVIAQLQSDDLNAAANRDFVKSAIEVLAPTAEEKNVLVDKSGALSKEGLSRLKGAVLASAYPNQEGLLEQQLESTDEDTRAVSQALLNAAPRIVQTRDLLPEDQREQYEIADDLVQAAQDFADMKSKGMSLSDYLNQSDVFGVNENALTILQAFVNPNNDRAAGVDKIKDFINDYLAGVPTERTATIFGDAPLSKEEILDIALNRHKERFGKPAEQAGLFGATGQPTTSKPEPKPEPTKPETKPDTFTPQQFYDGPPLKSGKEAFDVLTKERNKRKSADPGETFTIEVPLGDQKVTATWVSGKTNWRVDGQIVSAKVVKEMTLEPAKTSAKTKAAPQTGETPIEFPTKGDATSWTDGLSGTPYDARVQGLPEEDAQRLKEIKALRKEIAQDIKDRKALFDKGEKIATQAKIASSLLDLDAHLAAEEAKVKPVKKAASRETDADAADTGRPSIAGTRTDEVFAKVSKMLRPGKMRSLFIDLGIDPDLAENRPLEQRINMAIKGLQDHFGIKEIELTDHANRQLVFESLMELYHGLKQITFALDLPAKSIGLQETLSMMMMGNADYLGVYGHMGLTAMQAALATQTGSRPTIGLPNRSNSFAHEWFHALDYHLMDRIAEGQARGLSGLLRKVGEKALHDGAPDTVGEAFARLVNTMFTDQVELARKMMELEAEIAKAEPGSKKREQLEQKLEKLHSVASRDTSVRSDFWKSAKDFAKSDYWIRPTEMLARAGEAYFAHKIQQAANEQGGTVGEGLTKGDEAYLDEIDQRLRETFPKGEERRMIFLAFDNLFDAIRANHVLGKEGDAAVAWPGDAGMLNHENWFRDARPTARRTLGQIWNAEVAAFRRGQQNYKNERERPTQDEGGPLERGAKAAFGAGLYVQGSVRGLFLHLEKKHPNNQAITELIKRLFTTPGTGREQFRGGPLEPAIKRRFNKYSARFGNIVEKYGLDGLSKEDSLLLRRILISQVSQSGTKDEVDWYTEGVQVDPDLTGVPRNLIEGARDLRALLNTIWRDINQEGGRVGYAKSGYLTRNFDLALIIDDRNRNFEDDAETVYRLQFEKYQFQRDKEGILNDLLEMSRMKAIRSTLNGLQTLDEVKEIVAEINKKIAKAVKEETAIEDIDFEAEIDALYPLIRDAFSIASAQKLQDAIINGKPVGLERHRGMTALKKKWRKQRTLPPEADTILEKWLVNDPLELIADYMLSSAHSIEVTKRFGKGQYKRLINLLPREDRDFFQSMVDYEIGNITHASRNLPRHLRNALGWTYTIGIMLRLPRAVLSSIPEVSVKGMVTGKMTDSVRAWGPLFKVMLDRNNAHEMKMLSQIMGVIGDPHLDNVHLERLGGTFADDPKFSRRMRRLFEMTQLIGLTQKQWQSLVPGMQNIIWDLAAQYQGKVKGPMEKDAIEDSLRDMGILNDDMDQFTKWVVEKEGNPSLEDLANTDMGEIFGQAVYQMTRLVVQDPVKGDRPFFQRNTYGTFTLGIMSFSYAFQRNVTIRMIQQIKSEFRRASAKETKSGRAKARLKATGKAGMFTSRRVVSAMTGYYLSVLLITILREAALGQDRWEEMEEKEKGFPIKWLMELAWNRTGFMGAADPWYNVIRNVRYQRDITGLTGGGAAGTYWFDALQRLIFSFQEDSDNTSTAERARAISIWQLTVLPAFILGVTAMATGPLTMLALGGGAMYLTSGTARKQAADMADWLFDFDDNTKQTSNRRFNF